MASPKKKPSSRGGRAPKLEEKSFTEILASIDNKWVTGGISIDAEVFQSYFPMLRASRDAWRCNPYFRKYREQIAANTYGAKGIMLRAKVKETEDRVVYASDDASPAKKQRVRDEFSALFVHEKRINRLREWAEKKTGNPIEKYRAFRLADALETRSFESVMRGQAIIEVGQPDVFANQRIEAGWAEWQRAENCDVRGRRSYSMLRHIRLWSAIRDGEHFIRPIKDKRVNRFGYALQQVNAEWCDHFYNTTMEDGDVVRMGIRYPMTPWGIGKPKSYNFIKRIPRDWQTGLVYSGNNSFAAREEVDASEIIHYARFDDNEATRPEPWGISILGKIRHLDQYEIAEVVSARKEACSTGWLESTLVPEGGMTGALPDPRQGVPKQQVTPGGIYGLPWGVTYKANNPTHPSGNFQTFRQGMGQATSAGLPGADYNSLFNDLAMSFSSGRLGRLDVNEISRMLQTFDIETAECPIYEGWLECALIFGAIDLPFTRQKFIKFNKKEFQGRGFKGIDEVKDCTAAAMRIANKLSSWGRENAEEGNDFETVVFEQAEEMMLMESLGINPALTVQDQTSAPPASQENEE